MQTSQQLDEVGPAKINKKTSEELRKILKNREKVLKSL